jgi:GcrA cell cycle regulator
MLARAEVVSDADLHEAQRQSGWTEHRVAILQKLWLAGYSAAQCACLLGTTTRNAVISAVNRKGLGAGGARSHNRVAMPRTPRARKPRDTFNRPAAPAPTLRRQPPPPVDDLAIPLEQRRSLMQLDSLCCHWPVGDPREPDFFFCGAVAEGDGPYCAAHAFRSVDRTRPARQPVRERRPYGVSVDAWV